MGRRGQQVHKHNQATAEAFKPWYRQFCKRRFEIYGRDSRSLGEHWRDGMKTFHGFYSHGFPNCFHMGITQNGLFVNFTSMLDEQAHHIVYVLQQALARQARTVEPTQEAEKHARQAITTMRAIPAPVKVLRRRLSF